MQRSPQYYDLMERFTRPGCPICKLLQRDVGRYLDSLRYEYLNDVPTVKAMRAARGLCNDHSWQFADTKGNAGAIALLYGHALDALTSVEAARSGFNLLRGKASAAQALEPEASCPACQHLDTMQTHLIEVFAGFLSEDRFVEAFRASEGLCLPHVGLALREIDRPKEADLLLTIQRERWVALQAELDEFIRKSDLHYRDETFGEESDSWRRALVAIAGERGIFGLRRP